MDEEKSCLMFKMPKFTRIIQLVFIYYKDWFGISNKSELQVHIDW